MGVNAVTGAFFIDFEGEGNGEPVLLGVHGSHPALGDTDSFRQFIFDPVLARVGEESQTAHGPCVTESLSGALARLRDAAEGSNAPIYAWSTYEQTVIAASVDESAECVFWDGRVTDAKAIAKRWKRREHPTVQFPLTRGSGRHALRHYLDLIDYPIPTTQRGGKTGLRIRAVRDAMEKKGSYAALTGVQKRKWRSLLEHNWHDCNGMRELMIRCGAPT